MPEPFPCPLLPCGAAIAGMACMSRRPKQPAEMDGYRRV
jgi:hypothetical protein